MKRGVQNNLWRAIHLQTASKSLLREVAVKAYRRLHRGLSEDAILRYACIIGDFSRRSLVVLCEQLIALMELRKAACLDLPEVPEIAATVRPNPFDRLLP